MMRMHAKPREQKNVLKYGWPPDLNQLEKYYRQIEETLEVEISNGNQLSQSVDPKANRMLRGTSDFELVYSALIRKELLLARLTPQEMERTVIFADTSVDSFTVEGDSITGIEAIYNQDKLFFRVHNVYLAAGTIESTRIVVNTKKRYPRLFHVLSPIGHSISDHPIFHIPAFMGRSNRDLLSLNQQYFLKGQLGKRKLRLSPSIQREYDLNDAIVELAPIFNAPKSNSFLNKIDSSLNLLKARTDIELRRPPFGLTAQIQIEQEATIHNRIIFERDDRSADIFLSLSKRDTETLRVTEERLNRFMKNKRYKSISTTAENPTVASPEYAYHLIGALRLGIDESNSVVDLVGKLHRSPNLRILGCAILPTVGYVNPTLTALAVSRKCLNQPGN